jgi:hypothetical protein
LGSIAKHNEDDIDFSINIKVQKDSDLKLTAKVLGNNSLKKNSTSVIKKTRGQNSRSKSSTKNAKNRSMLYNNGQVRT